LVAAAAPTGPGLQALARRNELRAALKCYGPFHLVRVLPQMMVLAVAELVAAVVSGDRARAAAVVGSWRWNLRQLGDLRGARRAVKARRNQSDAEVRRLQAPGSARATTYLSRLVHQGFDVAHGRSPSAGEGGGTRGADEAPPGARTAPGDEPVLTGSVGRAFSEDADFDELDDLGRRAGRDRFGRRRPRRVLATPRSRLATWLVVAVVLVFGSRDLFAPGLPLVGQFLPLGSWSSVWHHLAAGWQPAGVGSTAPASPAFAVLGVAGTVLFGAMGLVDKVLVLGCIPLGGYGAARLLGPLVSRRARLIGAVGYLGLPLPYDDLARGRWDGLVAYALVPFVVSRLARASGLPPFAAEPSGPTGWRRPMVRHVVALGVLEAVAVAFAPAMAVVVLVCAIGVAAGSLAAGDRRASGRVVVVAGGATGLAAVLCGPWVVGTIAGGNALAVFGLAPSPSSSPGWLGLLRFAVGPLGSSPLAWLPVLAALLPLLIARRWRLAWATRLWAVALMSWLLAWLVGRGWTGSFAPSEVVLLAPAALGVAVGIGLGVSAFESDLSGYQFGWRQIVTASAVLATAVGLVPVAAEAFDGRWGLVGTGYAEPLAFMGSSVHQGPFRVLWLGDPMALPTGGWSIEPGLAYATSEDGTPDVSNLWSPAGPGPARHLAQAVSLAVAGGTSHLGRLLAPAGIRYVVLVSSLAPSVQGVQSPTAFPLPPAVPPALLSQDDLRQVPGGEGVTVLSNADFVPVRATRAAGRVTTTGTPRASDLVGWHPLPGGAGGYRGPVPRSTVLSSTAPAGRWSLTVDGRPAARTPAFGWAAQFSVPRAGQGRLELAGSPWPWLGLAVEVALWLGAAWALVAGRRGRVRSPAPMAGGVGGPGPAADGAGSGDGAGLVRADMVTAGAQRP
jgi:hypothetical protein